MGVSSEYLDKVGFATIRREPGDTSDEPMDELLKDYIEQARADMIQKGVPEKVANDETNMNVRGCIQSFTRWRFSYTNKDSVPNKEEYEQQLDELRKTWAGRDTSP